MNKILKVVKQNTLVRTTREEYYIDKQNLYDILKKHDIFYSVDWNSSNIYSYNTYEKNEETNELDFNRSITISQEKVSKTICDEIGIRGHLIIDSSIEKDRDGDNFKEIRNIYILVEKREVLENTREQMEEQMEEEMDNERI